MQKIYRGKWIKKIIKMVKAWFYILIEKKWVLIARINIKRKFFLVL
jgi:hypothetical protein